MQYRNPVLKGFYPDPSVCCVNGVYYMVCSSFQYFPGVPLFESRDLINWKQIGHVLTRPSQIQLADVPSSGGVFAATIRYHDGRFYMTTTNNTTQQNFYVWTDDIYGQWSDPVFVEQDGIDPSFFFEDGKTYFMTTGRDDFGESGIIQSQIDLSTGKKLTPSRSIWKGTGGRFVEGPHLYRIGEYYYLLASEGGTEYGHMLTLCRSRSVWGPFENCPHNPILTNRNKAPCIIQGIGHGELIIGPDGAWYVPTLGFRQIHPWMPYHHLGREVFLTPAKLTPDGWFTCGDGTTDECYQVGMETPQQEKREWTFQNTDWNIDWCFLRHPRMENYQLLPDRCVLQGTEICLSEAKNPTMVAIRQRDLQGRAGCRVSTDGGECGMTVYMCEESHYDIGIRKAENGFEAFLRLRLGDIDYIAGTMPLSSPDAELAVSFEALKYHFYANGVCLGTAQSRFLSSEVMTGFTGVVIGLYAAGQNRSVFTDFSLTYEEEGGKE